MKSKYTRGLILEWIIIIVVIIIIVIIIIIIMCKELVKGKT